VPEIISLGINKGNRGDFMMTAILESYRETEKSEFYFSPHDGFTYKKYKTWGDNVRVELIDGIVKMMAGASAWHQDMVLNLGSQLREFLKDKPCKPFISPFDVRLFPVDDEQDKTVVQPDIFVVCDKSKIADGKACKGAPDFIIEIMSDSSEGHDKITKKKLYEKAGVREYWIVDSENNGLKVYCFNESTIITNLYGSSGTAPVTIFPGLDITLDEVFA
jgi:Uma2 family endonuclease